MILYVHFTILIQLMPVTWADSEPGAQAESEGLVPGVWAVWSSLSREGTGGSQWNTGFRRIPGGGGWPPNRKRQNRPEFKPQFCPFQPGKLRQVSPLWASVFLIFIMGLTPSIRQGCSRIKWVNIGNMLIIGLAVLGIYWVPLHGLILFNPNF